MAEEKGMVYHGEGDLAKRVEKLEGKAESGPAKP